jgi:hypothetical protein
VVSFKVFQFFFHKARHISIPRLGIH